MLHSQKTPEQGSRILVADIFICYSSKDRIVAQRFAALFERLGWSVFMDTHIQAGHIFHVEIERQLDQARAVAVLWSNASRESEYVLDEAEEARKRDILIPALIEDVRIPYGFRRRQTADLSNWEGDEQHPDLQTVFLPALHTLLGSPVKKTKQTQPALKTKIIPPQTTVRKKAPLTPGKTFRDTLQNGSDAAEMIIIPSGTFMMGRPGYENGHDDELPQHEVTIAQPFAMGVYPLLFQHPPPSLPQRHDQTPSHRRCGGHHARAYSLYLDIATG